jgi:hypothetical protein
MNEKIIAMVTPRLVSLGWTPVDGTAIASKTYATAVGPKTAHIYLADYGPDCVNVALEGDYRSEGRNILEPCITLLPRSAQGILLSEVVKQFAQRIDDTVASSYAGRLLRNKDEQAQAKTSDA